MLFATLGSTLDSESKLFSEEPEWVIKSLLTNPPTTHPPTHPPGSSPGSWIFYFVFPSCASPPLCLSLVVLVFPSCASPPSVSFSDSQICVSLSVLCVPPLCVSLW